MNKLCTKAPRVQPLWACFPIFKLDLMKTFSLLGTVAPLLFLLSSCFEWHERMQLNEDGSGTYQVVIDMSSAKTVLDTAQQHRPDSAQEALFKQQLATAFRQGAAQLNELEGISEGKPLYDTEAYRFGLTFRFRNLSALNQALSFLAKTEEPRVFFRKKRKDLIREPVFPFRTLALMPHPEQTQAEAEQGQALRNDLLKTADYVFALHAPRQRIKRFRNKRAQQQGETKLTLRLPLTALLEDATLLKQEVRIK